jgi:hypothetical protein
VAKHPFDCEYPPCQNLATTRTISPFSDAPVITVKLCDETWTRFSKGRWIQPSSIGSFRVNGRSFVRVQSYLLGAEFVS